MVLDGIDEDGSAAEVLQDGGHVGVQGAANGIADDGFAIFGAEDEMNVEVLLHLRALLAAEGRIRKHHLVLVLRLHVGEGLGEGVGVDDVKSLNAVQDHVHDLGLVEVGELVLLGLGEEL